MPRWCWSVGASLYLSSSLLNIKNQETTIAERTWCAPVSSINLIFLNDTIKMQKKKSASSHNFALIMTNMSCWIIHWPQSGCRFLSSTRWSVTVMPPDSFLLPVCVHVCICRPVEVPVSAATGLSGPCGVGRPDWVLCLPLPKSRTHTWHRSPSPAGW